jgi:tetratricopeptide (TPR) repeat protein
MTDQISTKILTGRYQIIRILGEGGFGKTYLAKDNHLPGNPLCVVKQLKIGTINPEVLPKARELFDREARILQKLGSHPQIPKLYAFFEEHNEFYLVQDYIEGLTLEKEIEEKQVLSESEVILLLQDVLSILKFVHQEHVIHRDIKPANLIRRKQDNKFVLIDFGAVKQITNPDADSEILVPKTVGIQTKGYTPIEQLEGYPQPCSDIYALGITAVQALTGVHPKRIPSATYNGKLIWQNLGLVSKPLTKIIDKMIQPVISDRYQNAEEIIHDLEELLELSTVATEIPPSTPNQQDPDATQVIPPPITIRRKSPKFKFSQFKFNFSYKLAVIPLSIILIIGILELFNPIIRQNYYIRKGEEKLELYQPDEALKEFEKALALSQQSSIAWKSQGDAFRQLGRFQAAVSAYNKALQIDPKNVDALIKLGLTLYQQQKPENALNAYQKALEIDPKNGEAWSGKGLSLIGLKRYQEALEAFNKSQTIEPRNPKIWLNKALVFELLNNPQESRQVYEEALAIYDDLLIANPQNKVAWVDRGYVLGKLQKFAEAIKSYEKALEIDPDFQPAWSSKANMLSLIQENELALEAYQKAIELNPKDYLTLHNFAAFLAGWSWSQPEEMREETLRKALKSFEQVLEIKPDFYHAWRDRGLTLMNLNQYSEALRSFDQALNIDSNDDKSWILRAIALTELKRYPEALISYDKAIEINPNDATRWYNRGDLLEKMARQSEAVKSYEKAVSLDPKLQPAINALDRLR